MNPIRAEPAARYSARVRNRLGYSVVAPGFTGHVDGKHPKRLIDRAYRGRIERGDYTCEQGRIARPRLSNPDRVVEEFVHESVPFRAF